jgi:hypothetical protein
MTFTIYPRSHRGHWLFDDPERGIADEEFVYGMDTIIGILAYGKRGISRGVRLQFSDEPIEGGLRLDLDRPDVGGHWYKARSLDKEGWCCPTLLKYFPEAPQALYLRLTALKPGESWKSLATGF